MNCSFVSWKKDGVEVTTSYTVEYITNRRSWKIYQEGNHAAPWELLETRTFETVGEAMSFYIIRLYDQRTYFVNPVFEKIFLNGECIRESSIELNNTFHHSLAKCVERDLLQERDRISERMETLQKENTNMEKFIRFIGAWNQYWEYLKQVIYK